MVKFILISGVFVNINNIVTLEDRADKVGVQKCVVKLIELDGTGANTSRSLTEKTTCEDLIDRIMGIE